MVPHVMMPKAETMRERARAWLDDVVGVARPSTLEKLAALLEAVERETVERCAKVADEQAKLHHERYFMFASDSRTGREASEQRCAKAAVEVCAKAIRALAPAETKGEGT